MFEINLVPDIKAEMIRAQKIRNLIYFICFVVAAGSIGAVLFLMAIKTGQDIRMSGQDSSLKLMSSVIQDYDGLDEVLTVRDQLNKISIIGSNKKILSRVFNILNALRPVGEDDIKLSSLDVNLDDSILSFEAQAYAGEEPRINYRVLESFVKSINLMRYDYGRYVNEDGLEIPTRCIAETDENGNAYAEGTSVYAIWKKGEIGCDPSRDDDTTVLPDENAETDFEEESETMVNSDETERIWRTPQFDEWIKNSYMTTDGSISNIPHFESQCITYSGIDTNGVIKWSTENSCELAPEGIAVSNSVDAIQEGGGRVLRFNAVINLNEEVFRFANKHMLAIAPTGKTNVTDSYIQIGDMFAKRAKECDGTGDCN